MPVFHTVFAAKLATEGPYVVAFTAPKGTGKDTTARRLGEPKYCAFWEMLDLGLYRIDSVAGPLYRMVSELTGWRIEELQGPGKEIVWTVAPTPDAIQAAKNMPGGFTDRHIAPTPSLIGWSPRKLLEHFGSGVVRKDIGRDHWTELLRARLERHKSGITVLTDVRFVNECALCDLVIELRREGKDYDERPDDQGGHESRRRLPAHLIDFTYWLNPDMDYHLFADDLILKVERKRASRLQPKGRESYIEER
jgi:hypothetical protein